ncbi:MULTISPECIES: diguanylate cyclase [unclassified Sulfuricurvum]|uniref:GGDEF domain-containing protein n=1 Tax=unclassified Sulfuricurvum TaxID=2632390 RepID=UPI00029974AF|nr:MULTISPECIES: diguanylate cyclase [unclassified Sulfuricurvum]OHD81710.1 MAG: diguanylate cyclase [Sulfuricurvum sp. RIFCSPHIGHO2_02_FULL_43_9]OHD84285.1 MAG: diguanylate cyclase [Sulfuricurvum sp. RIFCSPHIGHO2_12_FULL_44_8]OHD85792.1 MAG: diguanylate cyclase [Sulfuricurvum sp. RIFCSPLOWO2_02_FULL_43_45]OHD87698.1 MAG: diguanylate cyclase [Sulfuricurvum sp. RIFCSPLOWO2_02_43_6]AFV98654.1 diguanylate cyclase [Candidatus Sulfuricurvum sp. RIFRC-1]
MASLGDLKRSQRQKNTMEGDSISAGSLGDPTSDLEIFSKEVLTALISDNLPPTPNNFALYFDRILDEKSESLRRQIGSILEFEEDDQSDKSIALEKTLKQGFSSVKSILQLSATLYKNISLMEKILEKRGEEIKNIPSLAGANDLIASLGNDVSKLSGILKKQVTHMKSIYEETATIVKQVENETIFDNQYGVYNKRYLIAKLEQERNLIDEFKHKSSLIFVRLSQETANTMQSEKAQQLMIRTVARLLLKTSRRSDIVAHFGEGVFAMVLKHTDIESAKRASERLYDLVASSNFFLAEQEIQLRIAIGVAELKASIGVDQTLVCTLNAMEAADQDSSARYMVCNQ